MISFSVGTGEMYKRDIVPLFWKYRVMSLSEKVFSKGVTVNLILIYLIVDVSTKLVPLR